MRILVGPFTSGGHEQIEARKTRILGNRRCCLVPGWQGADIRILSCRAVSLLYSYTNSVPTMNATRVKDLEDSVGECYRWNACLGRLHQDDMRGW